MKRSLEKDCLAKKPLKITLRRVLRILFFALLPVVAMVHTGCNASTVSVVNGVPERDANEIVVFLASKGIVATKQPFVSSGPGNSGGSKWSILVSANQATEAMSILNRNGLPRQFGTNLLDLFGKSGLMSSDKEETIRYQAGLGQQIANTIRRMDGVIDAEVLLSFPEEPTSASMGAGGGTSSSASKITAAVYVKHQGGDFDDLDLQLATKIKMLVVGSVTGLKPNDVSVISDRSRFTEVQLLSTEEGGDVRESSFTSIWSIVINKDSVVRFRIFFVLLIFVAITSLVVFWWLLWKCYPLIKKRGWKSLFHLAPLSINDPESPAPSPPVGGGGKEEGTAPPSAAPSVDNSNGAPPLRR